MRFRHSVLALLVVASTLVVVPTVALVSPVDAQSVGWVNSLDWDFPDHVVDSRAEVNGCGSQGEDGIDVPDQIFNRSFTEACNWHDQCYGTKGLPRSYCDLGMYKRAMDECEGTILPCQKVAEIYYLGVAAFGGDPYREGQRLACERDPERESRVWGDPHLRTLDGEYYGFMAAGEFTLLRDDDGRDLVQARFHPQGDSFTVVSGIAVRLGEREVVVQLDPGTSELSAFVDGEPVDRSMAHMDEGLLDLGTVLPGASRVVTIRGADGLRVDGLVFDGRIDISVHVGEPLWGEVSGLLGNADGNADNDLVDRDGNVVRPLDGDDLYADAFVGAHRIEPDASMFIVDESAFDYHADDIGRYPVQRLGTGDFESAMVETARRLCRDAGLDGDLVDPCIFDVLVSGDESFATASALSANRSREVAHPHVLGHGDPVDHLGHSPLIDAIQSRDIGEVRRLVASGADIDAGREGDGTTPLLTALIMGEDDIVRFLLSRGANPNGLDDRQLSPLSLVAISGQVEMARLLLDAGADPDSGTSSGRTTISPLGGAAGAGEIEMVALLLAAGADPDGGSASDEELRPAHHAVLYPEALRLLLDAGADPNGGWVRGGDQPGPLLAAAIHGRADSVGVLLEAGADRRSVNMELAELRWWINDEEILDLLG